MGGRVQRSASVGDVTRDALLSLARGFRENVSTMRLSEDVGAPVSSFRLVKL